MRQCAVMTRLDCSARLTNEVNVGRPVLPIQSPNSSGASSHHQMHNRQVSSHVGGVSPQREVLRTRIRPSSRWMALDLREIWRNRELLYFFVWRDLKVRYKQTAFGALWALIQPLALMAVFTIVFSRIAGIAPEGVP